ncbi:mechanosensitive ion channel family protein [Phaeacidiphilus oryzae]|uniref:mechanosensitive ion channel family protein n=1 Tax=Phaeacidiphilus oryzae TaxID=348818 RepID=UPI000AF08391
MLNQISQPARELAFSVDIGGGFSSAWSRVANFIPKFVAFLVILAIGWFICRLIAKVIDSVLRRIGSEKVAERSGVDRFLANSKYDMTALVSKIIYAVLLLMVVQLALGVFGANPISRMINGIVSWMPRGIVAVVIVVVAMAIANAVRDIVGSALSHASYGRTLATIAWAFIVVMGAFAALGQAGIATAVTEPLLVAALAVIAGVLVVGVGGGMIAPMRSRWERWLDTAERETANVRQGGSTAGDASAYQAGRSDAMTNQPVQDTERTGRGDGRTGRGDRPTGRGDRPTGLGDEGSGPGMQ